MPRKIFYDRFPVWIKVGEMENKIRVMLVDDHPVVRQGISALLQCQSDIEIVGEAGDGAEAVALARSLCPDVILMDLNMPKMNGLEATRLIKAELPGTWIIGLSINADDDSCDAMLSAGAACHLAKDSASCNLIKAIRNCASEK